MRIGTSDVDAIMEAERVNYPMHLFFENFDPSLALREHGWSAQDFIDAATHETLIDMKCWLMDAGRHRILIDSGIGNGKSRPGQALFDQLKTPRLERRGQAGARPEDSDVVVHAHLHFRRLRLEHTMDRWGLATTFTNAMHVFCRGQRDYRHRSSRVCHCHLAANTTPLSTPTV